MDSSSDPLGHALKAYHKTGEEQLIRVLSSDVEEDAYNASYFFRTYDDMPILERKALDLSRGKVLDIGAAAGCHSIELMNRNHQVEAIDISPLSVQLMKKRGISASLSNCFSLEKEQFDTILLLMNGIGIAGYLAEVPHLLSHLINNLAPGGQLIFDSAGVDFLYADNEDLIHMRERKDYVGEIEFQMQYGDMLGPIFSWVYVDKARMKRIVADLGLPLKGLYNGPAGQYLFCIQKP